MLDEVTPGYSEFTQSEPNENLTELPALEMDAEAKRAARQRVRKGFGIADDAVAFVFPDVRKPADALPVMMKATPWSLVGGPSTRRCFKVQTVAGCSLSQARVGCESEVDVKMSFAGAAVQGTGADGITRSASSPRAPAGT